MKYRAQPMLRFPSRKLTYHDGERILWHLLEHIARDASNEPTVKQVLADVTAALCDVQDAQVERK